MGRSPRNDARGDAGRPPSGFRQLLSDRTALIQTVADEAGLSTDAAREALDLVVSVGMAEADDGTIVGMDGLTTRRTRHGLVILDSVELWTWCAYDIVGIAAALGAEAVGRTQCGACGRPIEVVISRGQPEGTPVGWLPDESCSNVMAEFCPSALLFCSRAQLDEWRRWASNGVGPPWTSRPSPSVAGLVWRELVP